MFFIELKIVLISFFFFQAEDGIRDLTVTGVQTCALPILRGVDGVARVVEQLAGAVLPASALETHVLPARVADYSPAMLDELTAAGEVVWAGHGSLAGHDGLISLHPAAVADLTLPPALAVPEEPLHAVILEALAGGGAWFLGALAERVRQLRPDEASPSQAAVAEAVWDLVWSGHVTNDGLAPLRAWLGTGSTAHKTRAAAPRGRPLRPRLGLRAAVQLAGDPGTRSSALGVFGAASGGRWSLLPAREPDPTLRAHALAAQLLDRHGILTRAVAPAEGIGARFGDVYKVLSALEQGGQVRRGYFVERLGGSQFALPGAVDRLRVDAQVVDQAADEQGAHDPQVVVLAATDPANPYGASLPWPAPGPTPNDPAAGRHRPGRKGGALVVLVDGALVLYLERGGRGRARVDRAHPARRPAHDRPHRRRRGLGRRVARHPRAGLGRRGVRDDA